MTHEELISLIRQPQTVKTEQMADLKEMVEKYPYFVSPRILLAKALKLSNNINSTAYLNETALYCSDRRWFYYYIFPEKMLSEEPYRPERVRKTSGNYFEMIDSIESEGGDTKQSLKNLAEKLKEARAMVTKNPVEKKIEKPVVEVQKVKENESDVQSLLNDKEPEVEEISENNAKKLISERKYAEAIEILRALNLNNPKKSVYFADQIRFLEKVISNSKK
jgi:hypothetical protein